MKPKKEVKGTNHSKGKMMVLECDKKSKEERVKCEDQCRSERVGVRGNIGLRFRNKFCERRASKAIKNIDIARNLEVCTQNKCRKEW